MALETGTYISDLNVANPTSADPKSEGDDHLRLLKSSIKNTFPNVNGAVTTSPAELNILDGATLDTAELNVLDGMRADTAELNIMNGATMTTAELNYIDGVTSPIQPQIDSKAPIASPTLTGTPRAPTAPAATSGTQIATLDFVNSTILTASLPGQAGNAGALLSTDGVNANWTKTISGITINQTDTQFTLQDNVDPTKKAKFECTGVGTGQTRTFTLPDMDMVLLGSDSTQPMTNKTIWQNDDLFTLMDAGDNNKRARFECSSITTGTTRIITMPNEDITLGESPRKLLQTFTSNGGTSWDIEPTIIDNRYDIYEFEFHSLMGTGSTNFGIQFKAGGAYITTTTYYGHTQSAALSYGYLGGFPNAVNTCYAGTIRFYTPWSTAFKKYCYVTITDNTDFGVVYTVPSEGKVSQSSLLALQGFKLAGYGAASNILVGAVGKWYGIK
jgi:hypothetical protein